MPTFSNIKSIILDIADNYGASDVLSLRRVEFKLEGVLEAVTSGNADAYGTSFLDANRPPIDAFDTSVSKTGSNSNQWLSASGVIANQRLVCVFDTPIDFDEVVINNGHNSGGSTNRGSENVKIYTSTDAISNTIYNSFVTNSAKIYDGVLDEHVGTDTIDDQILTLVDDPGFSALSAHEDIKSIILDIADNYGAGTLMEIRSVQFRLLDSPLSIAPADVTCYATSFLNSTYPPVNAFDTSKSNIGSNNQQWLSASGSVTNQRVICVFDTVIDFDEIVINNGHHFGTETSRGSQNVKINTSLDAITSTVYDEAIANSTEIYDGIFDQHISVDVIDGQVLVLIESGLTIQTDAGAYSIAGSTVNLFTSPGIETEVGVYTIASPGVNLLVPVSIEVEAGGYTLTGSSADLSAGLNLFPEAGAYSITGSPVGLIVPVTLDAEAGSYSITGSSVALIWPAIQTEAGSYLIESSGVEFGIGAVPESTDNTIYIFTLTGSEDATTDIEIPFKSLQARLRSATPTYLQVVIPGLQFSAAITARPNGTMVVDIAFLKQGVVSQRNTIIEANLEDIRIDEGPINKTITLTGHKQETYNQKNITLDGQIYAGTINGETRYRFAVPNVYLNPGDIATVGDSTFTANVISYFIMARSGGMTTQMEISES